MLAPLLAALVTTPLPVVGPPVVSLPTIVLAPDGPEWWQRRDEAFEAIDRSVRPWTRLRPKSPEALGVPPERIEACRARGRLGCWVHAVQGTGGAAAQELLLLRLLPLPQAGRVLVIAVLVDVARAGDVVRANGPKARDAQILSTAAGRRTWEVTWGDGAFDAGLARLWRERKRAYEARGWWWPNGALEVRAEIPPPFAVAVDGAVVATATAATVRLANVAAGLRTVSVEAPGLAWEGRAKVDAGQRATLFVPTRSYDSDDPRPALLYTGIGLTAAGLAIGVAGAVAPVRTQLLQTCPASQPCEASSDFARWSDYLSPRQPGEEGSGPLVVPLGYSLAVTGVSWMLIAALVDEPEVPWWAVVLGGVLGGATYALTEAVD